MRRPAGTGSRALEIHRQILIGRPWVFALGKTMGKYLGNMNYI